MRPHSPLSTQGSPGKGPFPEVKALRLESIAEQFLRNTADGIWHVDAQGRIVYSNQRMADILGFTPDALVGENGFDFVHPEDAQRAASIWQRRLAGHSDLFEWRLRRGDGSYAWGAVSAVPLRGDDNTIVGSFITFSDITARKKAEVELREREALYRQQSHLLELAHDVILVRDLQDRVRFWNSSAEKTYGFSKQDALGCLIHTLLHTEFPRPKEELLAEVLRAGHWAGELMHQCRDGRRLTIDSRWAVQHDEAGAPVAILEINRDVTSQRKLERELRERESQLQSALLVSGTGTYSWDLATGSTTWDGPMKKLFGLRDGEEISTFDQFLEKVHPDDREQVVADCAACARARAELSIQYRIIRSDREVRWIHARGKTPEGSRDARIVGACIDITELRAAQHRIEAIEAQQRTILEHLPVGVWHLGRDRQIVFGNAEGHRIWSGPRGPRVTEPQRCKAYWHDTGTELSPHEWASAIAMRHGRPELNQILDIHCLDGTKRTILNSAVPVIESDGTISGAVAFNLDITEQARTQGELRVSRERLMAALAASRTGTFVWDIRTNRLEWDGELNRLFGLSGGQTAGTLADFFALVHGEDRARVVAACERCVREGVDFNEEFRVTLPDGSTRWLEDKGRIFADETGRPSYMTGACVDVTERKRAEATIRLNQHRFGLVRQASGIGFWFCDLPFDRLDWDARVKAHFGLPEDAEVTIATFFERLHPEDRERTRLAIEASITAGQRYDVEYRTVGLDGVTRWIRAVGGAHVDADGRPYRFDGITLDITETVAARQLLQDRGVALEQLVAKRTASLQETVAELERFSYSISHDLRAPLRAMQSFALILEEECESLLPPENRDYLRRIIVAANRMDRLIRDVLTYSRVAQAQVALQPVDLRSVIKGIIATYPQFHTVAADISLLGEFPPVLANEAAITQCVSNLLDNAFKFQRRGVAPHVQLWCETTSTGVRLLFADNGTGIQPEHQQRIFELFEQVNPQFGGTGIGLTIVRKAAEKMGARVGLTSTFGAGSTFWIEFQPSQPAA